MSPAYISPLQEHIIHACQQKFRLPSEARSFPPDRVYVTLMQLSPLWVHANPLGQRLYRALCGRMLDHWFVRTEQGLFTCLALALQQKVYVRYNMHQLLPLGSDAPFHFAVLDSLDPVYDEGLGLVLWKARFCLESFEVISVTGPVSDLVELFFNPRLRL
jgi:hypothetical protein